MSKHAVFLIMLGSLIAYAQSPTELHSLLQLQNDIKTFTPQPLEVSSNQELLALRARFIEYKTECTQQYSFLCQEMDQKLSHYEYDTRIKQRNYLESLTKRKIDTLSLEKLYEHLELIVIYRNAERNARSFNELFQYGLDRLGNLLRELNPVEISNLSQDYVRAIIKANDFYVKFRESQAVSSLVLQKANERLK